MRSCTLATSIPAEKAVSQLDYFERIHGKCNRKFLEVKFNPIKETPIVFTAGVFNSTRWPTAYSFLEYLSRPIILIFLSNNIKIIAYQIIYPEIIIYY